MTPKKKVTVAQIAKKLRLSPATVSFVLNGRDMGISEKTRERVIQSACELGYMKRPMKKSPEWVRVAYLTRRIEYFNHYTSFFSGVYNSLQKKASDRKMELHLLEFDPSAPARQAYSKTQELRSLSVDVFVTSDKGIVQMLLDNDMRAILVQGGVLDGCVSVYCDDHAAGRVAARFAWDRGHRRTGMIFFDGFKGPRFEGFHEEFSSLGGIVDDDFVWFVPWDHFQAEEKLTGLVGASRRLPTFFYCFADNIMFPATRAFCACGRDVPGDVSLMGTDNLYWGRVARPSFSTVDLNEELFADKVAEAVSHVMSGGGPYRLAVPVRLVERESVRDLRARA